MFGQNKEEEIAPGIKIMGFKIGKAKLQSDLSIGKGGYVRISEKVAKMLMLAELDYIIFGQFGSQLLIAKRPNDQFGHVHMKKRTSKRGDASSWYGNNSDVVKEFGVCDWRLADENIVADPGNNMSWVKVEQISQ